MNYLSWDQKTISDFSEENISNLYDQGYVFTRLGKGVMQQTRSVRIDLNKFLLSSENRRILKKVDSIYVEDEKLPLDWYSWNIAKLAKDFYDTKFGSGILSAQKIKEMLIDEEKSNFNSMFVYRSKDPEYPGSTITGKKITSISLPVAFVICYKNSAILHYSYPFYDLAKSPKDMGLGMMTMAIEHAKESGLKYIYLGSLQRPSDTYKLQFEGLEWFDGKSWQTDLESVKKILASARM